MVDPAAGADEAFRDDVLGLWLKEPCSQWHQPEQRSRPVSKMNDLAPKKLPNIPVRGGTSAEKSKCSRFSWIPAERSWNRGVEVWGDLWFIPLIEKPPKITGHVTDGCKGEEKIQGGH